jgi:hypothetical protein
MIKTRNIILAIIAILVIILILIILKKLIDRSRSGTTPTTNTQAPATNTGAAPAPAPEPVPTGPQYTQMSDTLGNETYSCPNVDAAIKMPGSPWYNCWIQADKAKDTCSSLPDCIGYALSSGWQNAQYAQLITTPLRTAPGWTTWKKV